MTVLNVLIGVLQVAFGFVFIAVGIHSHEDAGVPPPIHVVRRSAYALSSVLILGGALLMATP